METYEKEHLERVQTLASECVTFLKRNQDFPLSAPGRIALFGSGARRTVKGGTGSGDVNSRFVVSIEQGLENVGFSVVSKDWLDGYDRLRAEAREAFLESIRQEARKKHTQAVILGMGRVMKEPEYELPLSGVADCAIYVLSRNSGEGSDHLPEEGDILLSRTEIRDILAAKEKYQKFMLVLNVGGPVDLTPILDVENILLLSQLGAVTGVVFADILLGKAVPSGKLTTTWAAWEDYPTVGDVIQPEEVRYKEGVYVGYRWFDSVEKTPLFPFGFGLGYTDFSVEKSAVSVEGDTVRIDTVIRNTGSFMGKEVVQVYVSLPWGKLDQPFQTLAGFGKTGLLQPGECETVSVSFRLRELACWDDEQSALMLEKGAYLLRVGTDSRHTQTVAALTLKDDVIVRKLSHVGGRPDFSDWQPEKRSPAIPEGIPVLPIDPAAYSDLSWPVPHRPSDYARGFVSALSDEDLIRLCIGRFSKGFAFASVIGTASQSVAGAAGESCGDIPSLPPLVMADGPAGLRLNPHYYQDAKGNHPVGSNLPSDFADLMSPTLMKLLSALTPKPKGKIYEQYCTAIPIGTALAQSWNADVLEACGDIVGSEMERFGIHLWLAPAFNIHRTIRCGRNFEYYSEDPLLSGKMAAALTRGVQKHPGCGVTVKHFCCNNQELNRNSSSSNLSERALREIYMKPFEICLREAAPAALMSSYNLVNGVHSIERKDLIQTVLRDEWGWSGLVMTDWVIASVTEKGKYPCAQPAPAIAAGNLFMPGGQADYSKALKALKGKDRAYSLSREEAESCAAQVVDAVRRLIG